MAKVLLVMPEIAHYRRPIYEKLCANTNGNLSYSVAADERTHLPSLQILTKNNIHSDSPLSRKWTVHRCIWLPLGLMWQRGVIARLITGEFDVVIMAGDAKFLTVWISLIARRLLGKKSVLWTHGLRKEDDGVKRYIRRTFYSLADGLLLYGSRGKRLVEGSGVRVSHMAVVNNSLDYSVQAKIYESLLPKDILECKSGLGISAGAKVLITSGRLTERKQIDLLIKVLPLLRQSRPVSLIVVGDGPELDSLKAIAAENKVEGAVVFVGACYDEAALAALMRCADLFVLPGDAGLSAIHGLTYGLPVITHDNFETQGPEVEAIVEGVTGSFFESKSISSLRIAIEKWLDLVDAKGNTVGYTCREVVREKYSPDAQLDFINQAVLEVLSERKI